MFERYSVKARRVVFFARYEAGLRNATFIGTPDILLGIHREGLSPAASILNLRQLLDEHIKTFQPEAKTYSCDDLKKLNLPLHADAKKTLAFAAVEADSDASKRIEPEHLLRALLCFDNAASRALQAAGFALDPLRTLSRPTSRVNRFVRQIRWHAVLILRESVWPALWRLGAAFLVIALSILVLKGLGIFQ